MAHIDTLLYILPIARQCSCVDAWPAMQKGCHTKSNALCSQQPLLRSDTLQWLVHPYTEQSLMPSTVLS